VLYQGRLAGTVEETESGFRFTYEASFIEENIPISISLPY
jgi:HipA-like protein